MNTGRSGLPIVVLWTVAVVLMGGIFTSYHQPFNIPGEGVLALVQDPGRGNWRTLHILSTGCGCSLRVMQHLLVRHPFPDVKEQVLLIGDDEASSPVTDELIAKLRRQGFSLTRIAAKDVPKQAGLHGVPLLVVASPENKIAYIGGYGAHGDEDGPVLAQARAGKKMIPLPILGCAIGSRIRQQADPFGLKY